MARITNPSSTIKPPCIFSRMASRAARKISAMLDNTQTFVCPIDNSIRRIKLSFSLYKAYSQGTVSV